MINEGKVPEKEAKFYLIQHGECLIEKILLKEIADPYDLQKKLVSNVEKVNISVAGRGVIVGEELLVTGDEYLYGIRVTKLLKNLYPNSLSGVVRISNSTSNNKERI